MESRPGAGDELSSEILFSDQNRDGIASRYAGELNRSNVEREHVVVRIERHIRIEYGNAHNAVDIAEVVENGLLHHAAL